MLRLKVSVRSFPSIRAVRCRRDINPARDLEDAIFVSFYRCVSPV